MTSSDGDRLLDKLASRGMSRRQLLHLMGMAGAGAAAALHLDPVIAAIHWERHSGADTGSYEPRRGLSAHSLAQETGLTWIERNRQRVIDVSDRIWEHAELSMREWRSSLELANLLRDNGFSIEWGIAGMPTFYRATYSQGSGGPTLGFNAECDALPGLSQRAGSPQHDPLLFNDDPYRPTYGPGHGDAHNTLGAAAAAAAVATREAMRRHNVAGTLRVYGAAGEEQIVGKAYAVRAGYYDDLDAFVDWHPGTQANTGWGSNSAILSVVFTFMGLAGHGAEPLGNKSALDGVELLNIMTEYLREKNVAPSGRFHYAVSYGGEAPNVTPELAHVWYYVREGSPARVQVLFNKIVACAQAAAAASQTEMQMRIVGGSWNSLGNQAGTELRYENMEYLGPPSHSEADQALARAIQESLGVPQVGISSDAIPPLRPPTVFLGGPSSDMGDVSWRVPTIRGNSATRPDLCPNHHWNVTATASTGIAHEGMLAAARYIAATMVDLLQQPEMVQQVQEEFAERTARVQWKSLLPDDAQPPVFQPPDWFLKETNQTWPPPGIAWPPPRYVSHGKYGTTGPRL